MIPKDTTGKYAIRNCAAFTEWKYNTTRSDDFCTNLNNNK
jgi:hypothetical protein